MVLIKSFISIILLIALSVFSRLFSGNEKYMIITICGAIITCIPFFSSFEKKRYGAREIVTIAVMIALCVAGRFIFTFVPHFKPITAIIIITGMYFGCNAGFITGALSALLSNMYHGQGPWTIFQMAVWGLIGYMSGLLNRSGSMKNRFILILHSTLSGVIYSLVMDVYTVLNMDSSFSISRYIFYVAASFPVMITYIVSNIVFMLLFEKPLGKKLNRLKMKYGIFQNNEL